MSLGILVLEGLISCDYTHKGLHSTAVMDAKESTKREIVLNACLMGHFYSQSKKVPSEAVTMSTSQGFINASLSSKHPFHQVTTKMTSNRVSPLAGHFNLKSPRS